MKRLIDANRLWLAMAYDQTVDQYCYPCAERIGKAIKEQPTVNAIPIEFITERMNGYYKNSYTELGACLETLIEDWRKEHGTAD